MSEKLCPECKGSPVVTEEEGFLGDGKSYSIFHVCPKGFNVDEGPCLSRQDAVDAWNLQVDELSKQKAGMN